MKPGAAHGWWIVADMPLHEDCPQCNVRNPQQVPMPNVEEGGNGRA